MSEPAAKDHARHGLRTGCPVPSCPSVQAASIGRVRVFDVSERRARLSQRHHLAPAHKATDVLAAADGMVCLHATDPGTVYLSAWARIDDLRLADLDKALYVDRTLVKHMAMRRTLFVFRRELLGVIQAAASHRVAVQETKRLIKEVEQAGLFADGTAWLRKAQAATLRALERMGEASSIELRDEVEPLLSGSLEYAPHKSWGGSIPIGPRVMTTLSAGGRVLRASNRGNWYTSRPVWARTAHWLGSEPELPPEREARAELVRRWLHAFGPAAEGDVRWWLGSTLTAVRTALADIGAVEVDLHGAPGVALPDDLDRTAAVEPYAVLLPPLDPTTMGWASREWYLGPHREQLFDTAGNAGPTVWWNARIVGGWNQTSRAEVITHLLEDVGSEARAAIDEQAGRLTEWLDGVRVTLRFPSPLWRSLPSVR